MRIRRPFTEGGHHLHGRQTGVAHALNQLRDVYGSDAARVVVEQGLDELAGYTSARSRVFQHLRLENLVAGDLNYVGLALRGDDLVSGTVVEDGSHNGHFGGVLEQ